MPGYRRLGWFLVAAVTAQQPIQNPQNRANGNRQEDQVGVGETRKPGWKPVRCITATLPRTARELSSSLTGSLYPAASLSGSGGKSSCTVGNARPAPCRYCMPRNLARTVVASAGGPGELWAPENVSRPDLAVCSTRPGATRVLLPYDTILGKASSDIEAASE